MDGEPSFYKKKIKHETVAILGIYVDDCLLSRNEHFLKDIDATQKLFDSKPIQ